jgi:hypothetical protein
MTPTTPIGTRRMTLWRPNGSSSVSSVGRYGSFAASSSSPSEAFWTSISAFIRDEPPSRTSHSSISSWWASSSSAARVITAARSSGDVAAHAPCARAASVEARSMSAGVAAPISASVSPVAGSVTGRAAEASTQSPFQTFPRACSTSNKPACSVALLPLSYVSSGSECSVV